jgi:hypothetical protein
MKGRNDAQHNDTWPNGIEGINSDTKHKQPPALSTVVPIAVMLAALFFQTP